MTPAEALLNSPVCSCGTKRELTKADVFVCPHCDRASHPRVPGCPRCLAHSNRVNLG